jgi:phytoene dehydrogenase-like protein
MPVSLARPAQEFFRWQERTADALWDLALRTPAWPPQSLHDGLDLITRGGQWLLADLLRRANPRLLADALRPVAAHLKHASPELRLYIDGQLLIAAQATSATVNALYGASALDLPRRGVVHLAGGIGAIARTLADAVRRHGGRVLYRHEVEQVKLHGGQPAEVITRRGDRFVADRVIANLPPWNIAKLLGDAAPSKLRAICRNSRPTAGARSWSTSAWTKACSPRSCRSITR